MLACGCNMKLNTCYSLDSKSSDVFPAKKEEEAHGKQMEVAYFGATIWIST